MPAPDPTEVPETSSGPHSTEKMDVVEEPFKVEQPPSMKKVRKGRKRKSQVRFSPSPTREETAHHADVEDNIAITETPPTGRRRTVRPSKVLDMVNKTPFRNKPAPELQSAKGGEDKSNKRKRRESLGYQSSDGALETVEVPNGKKKSKPEPVGKAGSKVGGVRHPSVTKEETLAKSTNTKVSKPQTEDSPKTKSNMKQHTVGENTHKVIGTSKHNTRHHREPSPNEPEGKRGKRQEPEEGAIRNSGRRRSSSRDIKYTTNSIAGELQFYTMPRFYRFDFSVLKTV